MKLLRRTVKNYILYSALLLLICTPLYYISIRQLFVNEMEEELFHHKSNFNNTLTSLETEKDISLYQLINEEFQLKETSLWPISDSLFTYTRYDSIEKAMIPYRALRTGVTIHGTHYELIIRESIVGNTKLVTAIVSIQTTLLVLMLIGFILINRKLSKEVWDPFYTILEKLKSYQIDKDLTIDLPHSSTAEFRDLSEALVQLVNKSRDAYLSQKEFTENASHELQTPLAIFRSKLELLMQGAEITSEQAELISSLLNATDRIARLNKNLLLLSKIENRQFLSRQEVLLSSAITQTLGLYKQMALEKEIKITTHVLSEIAIKANPTLLDILLSNLISNAIRHTPAQREVKIKIENKSVTISNPGEPFNFPNKIFDRFNRESRTAQGNGLGLAIVKKICDSDDLQITYLYSDGSHHFTVNF